MIQLSLNSMDSIYIQIDGYWFNVTHYDHPGGKLVLSKYHLKDATEAFNNVRGHVDAYQMMSDFEIKDSILLSILNKNDYNTINYN